MTKQGSDGLFEVPASAGTDAYEEPDLKKRTNFQSRATRSGADFKSMALTYVQKAGGEVTRTDFEIDGMPVDAEVSGGNGRRYLVLARGTPSENKQSGLRRTDTVEKMGFMAMQLVRRQELPILVITSDVPRRTTKAGVYLAALDSDLWDVVGFRGDLRGFQRLQVHFSGDAAAAPAAPWRSQARTEEPTLFDENLEVRPEARASAVNESLSKPSDSR